METFLQTLRAKVESTPYFHLDGYMERWWATSAADVAHKVNVRLHHILRSDKDEHFHDHPWESISILIAGGYHEVTPTSQTQDPKLDRINNVTEWRGPGSIVHRKANDRHRILVPEGTTAWSLFITGEWEKDWGFYTPEGFIYWRLYLNQWDADPAPGEATEARPGEAT